jgi:hypothetical protein
MKQYDKYFTLSDFNESAIKKVLIELLTHSKDPQTASGDMMKTFQGPWEQ